MSSLLGTLFRVATWGESHGGAVGVVIDGCPPRLPLAEADLQPQLDRRRPGQSRLTTPRQEADRVHILSGVFEGKTLGTPILLSVDNTDARPREYEQMREIYRPSHADFTYDAKFGIRNWQGGGRTSARETIGRVAAGAVAEKLLARGAGIEIVACVERIGSIEGRIGLREEIGGGANGGENIARGATARGAIDLEKLTRKQVDRTPVRCPDLKAAAAMIEAIEAARRDGDSLGGVIRAVVRGVPAGLGSPVFDRLEADLAKAMMSLPATKGFEVGSGFAGTLLRGSEHNDAYIPKPGRVGTRTNRSGGIQGGISNGETITMRIAFKPTATIRKPQVTVDTKGRPRVLAARGRHDPCVLPRAVPMVEAMAALVLVDHWLQQLVIEESARRIDRSEPRGRRR